jgi:hypothetical protein
MCMTCRSRNVKFVKETAPCPLGFVSVLRLEDLCGLRGHCLTCKSLPQRSLLHPLPMEKVREDPLCCVQENTVGTHKHRHPLFSFSLPSHAQTCNVFAVKSLVHKVLGGGGAYAYIR